MKGGQTRLVSIIEVSLNVATGFIFAMLVWKYIIPVYYPRMVGPVDENLAITTTFTVVSILRSLGWRRFFANGLHKVLVNWVGRLWSNGDISRVPGAKKFKIGGGK